MDQQIKICEYPNSYHQWVEQSGKKPVCNQFFYILYYCTCLLIKYGSHLSTFF